MANALLTNDIILPKALMEFENNLIFAKTARRDYEGEYDPTTGNTIRIRKPTRFIAREGRTANPQDIDSRNTDMVIAYQDGVDLVLTSAQLALELDDFNREVLNPAMVTLANKVDTRLYATTSQIYNFVGTAGTAPNSFATINNGAARLSSFGIPRKDRFALLKTFDAAAVQNALYNTFNENFNKDIILDGSMGNLAGFDVYDVENTIRPLFSSLDTDGAQNVSVIGTPAVNGSGQSGASLVVDGFTNSTTGIVKAGATFTIAGVNSVNPTSRSDTGQLMQFTVTADADSGASTGPATLSISPAIVLTGPYQNVTALPADNALLTFNKSHTINIGYHREAFALSVVKLPVMPEAGVSQKAMVDPKAKVSLRISRQYDIINDRYIVRFDIFYGVKCFPEYATRIMGS